MSEETAAQRRFTYLDYAASAPMCPEALEAERAYEASEIAGANPNSLHTLGREADRALDGARRDLALCLGAGIRPDGIVFTSGGTESNNLALHGLARAARDRDRKRTRVVISAIEHDSELDVAPGLRDEGFEVTLAQPQRDGRVYPEDLEALLGPDVALVSVMSANNETGMVQPVGQLAHAAHAAGALMHTDAVQAFGRIPLQLEEVDAVSIAAHKIGGPVGIGALALRGRIPIRPMLFGGGQEKGRRSGTQAVRAALAFAAAAKARLAHLDESRQLVAARSQRLYDTLCAPGTGLAQTVTGPVDEGRLPGMVSVMTTKVDSETLVLKLDQAGFAVSAGSACSSGSLDASHVLLAMGIPREEALGSLRVSFDETVPEGELNRFAQALLAIVTGADQTQTRSRTLAARSRG